MVEDCLSTVRLLFRMVKQLLDMVVELLRLVSALQGLVSPYLNPVGVHKEAVRDPPEVVQVLK